MASKASVIGETHGGHVGSKQLICLRDLTKHRGDCGLSPPGGSRSKLMTSRGATSPLQRVGGGLSPGSASGAISARPPASSSNVTAAESRDNSPIAEADHMSPTSPTSTVTPLSTTSNSTGCHSSSSAATVAAPLCRTPSSHGHNDQVSPPPMDAALPSVDARSSPLDGANNGGDSSSNGGGTNQLNKLKRFLSTVQQFADDISPDIGDRVRALVLALVNSQLPVEEFHRRLQETTNFPLRPFVVPFLKTNLPLLQQELQTISGRRSTSPISPQTPGGDPRLILPLTVRPTEQRHPLWYLGPLPMTGRLGGTANGTLVPPRTNGLDVNANGKRPSAFERLNDSPIDLKLDLLAPVAKRLHIDIPGLSQRSTHEQLPPFVINPVSAAAAVSATMPRNDDNDRDRLQQRQLRDRMSSHTSNSNNHCLSDQHSNNNVGSVGSLGLEELDDEWHNVDTILHSIVQMVDRCRRAMIALKEQCRRDHVTSVTAPSSGGQVMRTSPGTDVTQANIRLVEDLHVLQVRQLAEEAVNEVKRQAVAELHRAVAAAEVKATVTVTAERARLEKVIGEVRTQARQEAFALLNSQEDSTENCWNCGRKAFETCSGCHRARYCGTFCQHRHWETHHLTCRPSSSTGSAISRHTRRASSSPEFELIENIKSTVQRSSSPSNIHDRPPAAVSRLCESAADSETGASSSSISELAVPQLA